MATPPSFASLVEKRLEVEKDESWLDFLFDIFPKTGREYFSRHLKEDPRTDRNLIWVLFNGDTIVSTIRIFVRDVFIGGKVSSAGGIGEVSTRAEYRGAGLASRLVTTCIEEMKGLGMELAVLHAGRAAPIYERKGFKPFIRFQTGFGFLLSESSLAFDPKLLLSSPSSPPSSFSISHMNFDSNEDVSRLVHLYHNFNSNLSFSGWFTRSDPNYWKRWVRAECPQGMKDFFVLRLSSSSTSSGPIVAFFSAKELKRVEADNQIIISVTDFGVDLELTRTSEELSSSSSTSLSLSSHPLFELLTRSWLLNHYFNPSIPAENREAKEWQMIVMLPTPVVNSLPSFNLQTIDVSSSISFAPRVVEDLPIGNAFFLNVYQDEETEEHLKKGMSPASHVFWGSDDF